MVELLYAEHHRLERKRSRASSSLPTPSLSCSSQRRLPTLLTSGVWRGRRILGRSRRGRGIDEAALVRP